MAQEQRLLCLGSDRRQCVDVQAHKLTNPWRRRYHQYKFIVDGEWRHDETQPFMPDPLGNVNNWLFVRRPEGAGQQCGTQCLT